MFGTSFPAALSSPFSRLVMFALLMLALTTSTATAQYCTPDQCDECNLCQCNQSCCHSLPELWLINTRCAPRCKNLDNGFECLTYKRYDRECCRWVKETRESFLTQEATMPTLFYAHGNSLNHKNAMKACWMIYKKMRCCPGPKRLVFWSWPAERVYKTERLRVKQMIKKNLRIKYVYAEYQAYYMAKLVDQMSLTQRVMMSGHSYGAITSAAAAHLLGGGCVRGLTLEGAMPVERPNLRFAAISGAFDHDMLIPGHRYGQAFVASEKVFVTRNINDRTLKKWPDTSLRCQRAIGVLGVNANHLGDYRSKLCQKTMSSDVGTSHYLKPHLKSVRFVSALCCLSFNGCQEGCLTENTPTTTNELAITEDPDANFISTADDLTANALTGPAISLWDSEGLTEIDLAEVMGDAPIILSLNDTSDSAPTTYDSTTGWSILTKPISKAPQTVEPEQQGPELQQPKEIANGDVDTTTAAIDKNFPGQTADAPLQLASQSSNFPHVGLSGLLLLSFVLVGPVFRSFLQ